MGLDRDDAAQVYLDRGTLAKECLELSIFWPRLSKGTSKAQSYGLISPTPS